MEKFLKEHGWNLEKNVTKMYGNSVAICYYTKDSCCIKKIKVGRNKAQWCIYTHWNKEMHYGKLYIFDATKEDILRIVN